MFFLVRGRVLPAPDVPVTPPAADVDVDADNELDSLGAVAPDGVRRGDGGGRGMEGTRFGVVDIVVCRVCRLQVIKALHCVIFEGNVKQWRWALEVWCDALASVE